MAQPHDEQIDPRADGYHQFLAEHLPQAAPTDSQTLLSCAWAQGRSYPDLIIPSNESHVISPTLLSDYRHFANDTYWRLCGVNNYPTPSNLPSRHQHHFRMVQAWLSTLISSVAINGVIPSSTSTLRYATNACAEHEIQICDMIQAELLEQDPDGDGFLGCMSYLHHEPLYCTYHILQLKIGNEPESSTMEAFLTDVSAICVNQTYNFDF